ncbi:MAG: segregation and condensation protein A [Chlamydiales bacterium]|jgi:segregation and condensation protein A
MVRTDYTVRLQEVFHGPMDLLIHLVREQEVEIHEIEIHSIIDSYFTYLQNLKDLDIEVAGDFLVMAATLMAIKSRSLLPREEVELEDELDPEDELIQRLVEYRRFKGAADDLEFRAQEQVQRKPRGYTHEIRDNEPERTLDLGELTAWDLLATFSRLMRETLANRPMQVAGARRPLRWYVRELGRSIQAHRRQTLRSLVTGLEDEPSRDGMIGAFCALLELIQMGLVSAVQDSPEDEIEVVLAGDPGEDLDLVISGSQLMDEEDPGTPEGLEEPASDPEPEDEPSRAPQG